MVWDSILNQTFVEPILIIFLYCFHRKHQPLVTEPEVWVSTQSTDDRQWLSSASDVFTHISGTTRATDSTDMSELKPCIVGRSLLMTDNDCPLLLILASVVRHESPIRMTCFNTTRFRWTALLILWQYCGVCLGRSLQKTDNDCPLPLIFASVVRHESHIQQICQSIICFHKITTLWVMRFTTSQLCLYS